MIHIVSYLVQFLTTSSATEQLFYEVCGFQNGKKWLKNIVCVSVRKLNTPGMLVSHIEALRGSLGHQNIQVIQSWEKRKEEKCVTIIYIHI